jgi:hypothetical protein
MCPNRRGVSLTSPLIYVSRNAVHPQGICSVRKVKYCSRTKETSLRPSAGNYNKGDPPSSTVRCAQVSGYEPPNNETKRAIPLGAVLPVASHATHSSILAARAPSSSVPSAITLSTPDSSGRFDTIWSSTGTIFAASVDSTFDAAEILRNWRGFAPVAL